MSLAREDITVDQAANLKGDWQWVEKGDPKDLSGFTAHGHVRQPGDSNAVLLDLSPYLTVIPAEGRVLLDVPKAQTEHLSWVGAAWYDILLYDGSTGYRLVEGAARFSPAITRGIS